MPWKREAKPGGPDRARGRVTALLSLLLAPALASTAACDRSSSTPAEPEPRAANAGSPPLVHYPLEPLPTDLQAKDEQIHALQRSRRFTELLPLYESLLDDLAGRWGAASPRLAAYHYNLCLTWKLSGDLDSCRLAAARGLERWPNSLQHTLLAATAGIEASKVAGTILPAVEGAVARVLEPRHGDGLRACRVDPDDVRLSWADLLLAFDRAEEAARESATVLRSAPENAKALLAQGRALVRLRRTSDAVAVLSRLPVELRREPATALELAEGHLALGAPAEAADVLERCLEAAGSGADSPQVRASRGAIAVKLATAYNRLERFADARQRLLERLRSEANDPDALHQLAISLRGLGVARAEEAAMARQRSLTERSHHLSEAAKGRVASRKASEAFHRALAARAVDRLDQSIEELDRGLAVDPRYSGLHQLRIELLLELGRGSLAIPLVERAKEQTGSPLFAPLEARVLARAGRASEARAILGGLVASAEESSRTRWLREVCVAQAQLELDDDGAAARLVASCDAASPAAPPEMEALELSRLVKALNHLQRGAASEARALIAAQPHSLLGGDRLRDALALLVELAAGSGPDGAAPAGAARDPSGLIDHPWLLRRAASFPELRDRESALGVVRAVEAVSIRRAEILSRMGDFGDADVLPYWKELIDLYLGADALRKAREAAWYLRSRAPRNVEIDRWLIDSLSRDEDVFDRLAAVELSLTLRPGDAAMLDERRRARAFLGLDG